MSPHITTTSAAVDAVSTSAGIPSSSFTSASVFRSFFTDIAGNCVASDRASTRSILFCTVPVSVTRPPSTTLWMGGFAMIA